MVAIIQQEQLQFFSPVPKPLRRTIQHQKKTLKRPAPGLPTEIRVHITSYITSESNCSRCILSNLFSLSLVSRSWSATANYHLYNHLRLDLLSSSLCQKHAVTRSFSHFKIPILTARKPDDAVLSRLSETLHCYPYIADSVREITLSEGYDISDRTADVVRACESVEYIHRAENTEGPIIIQTVTKNKLAGNDWGDVVNMLEKQRGGWDAPPRSALQPITPRTGNIPTRPQDRLLKASRQDLDRRRRSEAAIIAFKLPKNPLMKAIATRSQLKCIELGYELAQASYPSVIKAEEYYPLERWYNVPAMEEAYFKASMDGSSSGTWNLNMNSLLRDSCSKEISSHISKFLRAAYNLQSLKLCGEPKFLENLLRQNRDNLKNLRRLNLTYEKYVPPEQRDSIWELLKELMNEVKLPSLRELWCLVGFEKHMTASNTKAEFFTVSDERFPGLGRNKLEAFTMRVKGVEVDGFV